MMFSYTPVRMAALGFFCASVGTTLAQPASSTLPETVVTAARMAQDPSLLPQGVQVITAQQIRESGAPNVREAIRWIGGVYGRADTSSGREPTLDLRGFGATASSNVVILVDGVRQNEGDMASTVLSWLPIDSIERIEVVRGGAAVLHGEGATGGVINIITSKGLAEPGNSASLTLGSFDTRDVRASVRTRSENLRMELHANTFDSDNHRQFFGVRERNALARATWAEGSSSWSVQLGGQSSEGNQPGGVTPQEFLANPRLSYKARDMAKNELGNLLLSGETQLGAWRTALDLNYRKSRASTDQQSAPDVFVYTADTDTESTRLGGRIWRGFDMGVTRHRLLLGVDAEQWSQSVNSSGYFVFGGAQIPTPGRTDIDQESRAAYVRHEIDIRPQGLKVFAGARRTWSDRQARGSNGGGAVDQSNNSWELGGAKRIGQGGEVFSKVGTSFRLPNANEYTCFDPTQCAPTVINLLKPQTSHDFELGYRRTLGSTRWSVNYYRHELDNEIGYEGGANRNFDSTRRDGVEAELAGRIAASVDGAIQYAWRRARFTAGAYQGKDIPWVPGQTLTARVNWRMSATQLWTLSSQLVSSQRIADDFANSSPEHIAGYGVMNLRYSQKVDAHWTLSAMVNNLADKAYYNYRTRVSPTARSVYPEAGRAFYVTALRTF